MISRLLLAATTATALCFAASANAQEIKGEVIHQWTSAAESAGVKVLAQKFTELGGTWVDNAISGGPNARSTAVNRVVGGNPPAAMLFNTGAQFVELQDNGLLRDLTETAKADNWQNKMPAALLNSGVVDGEYWALPISGNGANWFWFNKSILEKIGVAKPKTWDDVFVALDKAKAAGLAPFTPSGEPRWQRLMFNAVVLSVAGRDTYDAVIYKRDASAVRGEKFKAAVKVFEKLRDFADAGTPGRSWPDSTNLVISGKALMTQGGTWLNGAFAAAGKTAGTDYECAIINPDQGMVISGDVFLFPEPKNAAMTKAQDLLLKAFADVPTQTAFAVANGTIPILKGADTSKLNPCIAEASRFFNDPKLSTGSDQMMFTPAIVGAVEDAITRFATKGGLTAEQFIEAYAKGLSAS